MPYLRWDEHSTQVMSLLRELYKNLEFTDCTLDTNGGLIRGHKILLVACSPYLKKLIADHQGMDIIPLKEVKYDDMKLVLDFLYFGEVDVPPTDVSSLIETARLLQIPSFSDFSLTISETMPSNRRSHDGSADDGGRKCTVNLLKCDDSDLSEQHKRFVSNQDMIHDNEYRLTANFENTCDSKTHTGNFLKEMLQTPNENLTNSNIQNFSVTREDKADTGTDNCQEELNPFSFVAVSPCSVKREQVDDELNAICKTLSDVENPLEDNRVNGDTTKIIKREGDFQCESEVKREIKEEHNVSESVDNCKPMEVNHISHRKDENLVKNSENFCGKENIQNVTLIKSLGCTSSNDCFADGMNNLHLEFESICDITKCESSKVKPFETGSDNNSMNDNSYPVPSNEVCESSESGGDTIPIIDFEKDVNQASDALSTRRLQMKELSIVLERVDSCLKMKVSNNPSACIESSGASRNCTQPTIKENKVERRPTEDSDSVRCDLVGTESMRDDLFPLGEDPSDHVTESAERANCSREEGGRPSHHNDSGSKVFVCNICELQFNKRNTLKKHMLIHASDSRFLCNTCNKSFASKCSLMVHMRTHTREKSFKCVICEARFFEKRNLNKHLGIHALEKSLKCEICGALFDGNYRLKTHMRIHTGEKPFQCDICQATLCNKSNLRRHKRVHAGEKPFICDICGGRFPHSGYRKVHMRIHTGEKPFKCDICQATFTEKGSLKMHIRIHTGEKPFKCDICAATFSQSVSLKTHLRIHTGEKPFSCSICQTSYNEKGTLKRHQRVHTGEKPFKCDICQATFSESTTLRRHILIHKGEKPFQCECCGARFIQYSHLKKHMGIHSCEKPFKCDMCQATFTEKGSLKMHIRIHTGEKPFKCDICAATFSLNRNLKNHMRIHTG